MDIEIIELFKIISSIIIITIPGYLWSYLFSKKYTVLERLIFGFIFSIIILSLVTFVFEILFNIKITAIHFFLFLIIYSIPVVILYIISIKRFGFGRLPNKKDILNLKTLALLIILLFVFIMTLMPHWTNSYYFPFHVDEWIHYSYTSSLINSGSTTFVDPFTGNGIIQPLEIGFHIITANIYFLSGSSLIYIFIFLPSIIMVLLSICLYNIGQQANHQFGFESAFLVILIPTTCRFLGPSFYIPVSIGILILAFIIWLAQRKKLHEIILIPLVIFFLFILHPPTALAGLIIILIYSLWQIIEKNYKTPLIISSISILTIIIIFLISTRWKYGLNYVFNALSGTEYALNLPPIWINLAFLGFITWIFFIIGIYYSFANGKAIHRTISLSSLVIIIMIVIYNKFGYGVPIFYERGFLYLYFLVTVIASIGLGELRYAIKQYRNKIIQIKIKKITEYAEYIIPIFVILIIILTVIPTHFDIKYYQMISDEDYETFTWIHDNIESYRNETNLYQIAAVDPFIALPFSAVTGLYTISSSMHPVYGYDIHGEMIEFLNNGCKDINFIERYNISIIYNKNCNNDNLKMIYPNVYIYQNV